MLLFVSYLENVLFLPFVSGNLSIRERKWDVIKRTNGMTHSVFSSQTPVYM